tara:strand:+ start:53 stop:493 length:441 start_codon:yes stop_codon:yes gene_type:complete
MSLENNVENSSTEEEANLLNIDSILEQERQHNKTESWMKLDKNIKRQLLHSYAEKYGKEHNMPVKDIKSLKMFFSNCLEKNRLNRTKDVNYNKEMQSILSIPSLYFNKANKNFTLKIVDAKRVSTLKSLAPKKKDKHTGSPKSDAC